MYLVLFAPVRHSEEGIPGVSSSAVLSHTDSRNSLNMAPQILIRDFATDHPSMWLSLGLGEASFAITPQSAHCHKVMIHSEENNDCVGCRRATWCCRCCCWRTFRPAVDPMPERLQRLKDTALGQYYACNKEFVFNVVGPQSLYAS